MAIETKVVMASTSGEGFEGVVAVVVVVVVVAVVLVTIVAAADGGDDDFATGTAAVAVNGDNDSEDGDETGVVTPLHIFLWLAQSCFWCSRPVDLMHCHESVVHAIKTGKGTKRHMS